MKTIACALLTAVACLAAPSKVGVWERFEASVTNSKAYADPYRDVELNVTYTKPGGARVQFWGFYDGDKNWRIRFMPDVTGTWTYDARFSDGQPGIKGSFTVVRSDIPGLLSQHAANPIWFGHKGGKRALLRSFHTGDRFFARNWDDPASDRDGEKRKLFLDWFQKQGYNTLSIASHYLNRNVAGRGAEWNTPDLWPLNAAEYRSMEMVLDDLMRRRIYVYPFAGFFGKEADFPKDAAQQELYIKYTLARLGPYWNIMLLVGGPEPLLKKNPHLSYDDVNRLGALITKLDVFGHLLSVHNPTGDDLFKDQPWVTYGVMQGPKTLDPAKLSAGMLKNHHASKPLYAQETLWPGNTLHPPYTTEHARKNGFVLLMSAAMINYADMKGLSSSGFSGTMDLKDKVQPVHDVIRAVWDFFETVPFERTKPRQDLVDNGYCLGEEGRFYLVYLDKPGSVNVKTNGSGYKAEWIHARDTKDVRPATLSDGRYETPSDGDDWLLRLSR